MLVHHNLLRVLSTSAGVISRNGGFGGLHPHRLTILALSPTMTRSIGFAPAKSTHRCGPVLKNLNLFKGDQTACHHSIQHWQEGVDLFLTVDDLNHDR
jgi:hypothetical protein